MISMKVTDKDVIDAMEIYLQAHQLHLCTFPAVYQKMPVLDFDQLRCRMSPIRWQRTT
jgi:hypothetical protein